MSDMPRSTEWREPYAAAPYAFDSYWGGEHFLGDGDAQETPEIRFNRSARALGQQSLQEYLRRVTTRFPLERYGWGDEFVPVAYQPGTVVAYVWEMLNAPAGWRVPPIPEHIHPAERETSMPPSSQFVFMGNLKGRYSFGDRLQYGRKAEWGVVLPDTQGENRLALVGSPAIINPGTPRARVAWPFLMAERAPLTVGQTGHTVIDGGSQEALERILALEVCAPGQVRRSGSRRWLAGWAGRLARGQT